MRLNQEIPKIKFRFAIFQFFQIYSSIVTFKHIDFVCGCIIIAKFTFDNVIIRFHQCIRIVVYI